MLPIMGPVGVPSYIQILTNGVIVSGAALKGSTHTLQFDGISDKKNG
ncbi:hypothetical protein [Massilia sp. DWR3-1-1]